MFRIGILGSGIVGKTLAGGFVQKGYGVTVGSGSPEKIASWKEELGGGIEVGDFRKAAAEGDVLVLAVKGSATVPVLDAVGRENRTGKVIIDACNPIADEPPDDGVLRFFTEPGTSLMETLQTAYPEARFVKAFSCIGASHMVDPDFGGGKPTMFGCGDDPDAKGEVQKIVEQFGFEWADMGSAKSARAIEPLCVLWCIPGFRENRWDHAFRLLRK
jgi:8-hydroxy-5-deazaflavin:NADPH oxidoreductase